MSHDHLHPHAATGAAEDKAREWRSRLLAAVGGLLIFETISGIAIWMLPFSVSNQINVLVHTLVGLIFLAPFGWYMIRHLRRYFHARLSHTVVSGYFAAAATLLAIVSGVALTYQALFGTYAATLWRVLHQLSTIALIVSAGHHAGYLIFRNRRASSAVPMQNIRRATAGFGRTATAVAGMLVLAVFLLSWAYRPVPLDNELPEDYAYLYGDDRPFAPSLAQTTTGGAFDARSMGGSEACGKPGCHREIYDEWQVSAHRWSALDPAFRAVQATMGNQNGPESTRYCGGCHDPISLFSGTKNLFQDELTNEIGLDEGVSCIACHSIKETDVKGNANYTIAQPERYMFELHEGSAAGAVSDFLIRAYPEKHVETLQHSLFKSPEFCAACHKQFIDEEINQVGWVQLQNQYDNWRKSRWNHPGDPTQTIECRECHMPLVDSRDPASGDALDYNRAEDDGKHRSHRFLGANQFIPAHLGLPGADEQVELTNKWLKGELPIPEIADKWQDGPAVPIELIAPETVAPGDEVAIEVHVTNNKLGHDFPTGPLDIIQAWVEVVVTDASGNEVFSSGKRDEEAFIEPGSFIFKAEPVDRYGNLIDRHNLWEMVGVRFRRSLFPGFSDRAQFVFNCPTVLTAGSEPLDLEQEMAFEAPVDGSGRLTVRSRLLYRKIDQYLLNFLFGQDSGLTAPVAELSTDEKTIVIRPESAP